MKLFTIGHSAHSPEKFVRLLQDNGIMTVVDVRTAPVSRFHSQFNKDNLEYLLPQHGIRYVFAGKHLGGRPADPTCYKRRDLPPEDADYLHEVDYPEVMKRQWFIDGVKRLLELAGEHITAVMCSEEDPATCHRHHLIAKYVMQTYPEVTVRHIRGDGVVFSAASLLASVDTTPSEQLTLF
ncbi:MAG: DUF488 domain-containing protein [Anaerolineae bacterium]|nr:DUF488 domain-containing protein [Anaerolineae bacterium]